MSKALLASKIVVGEEEPRLRSVPALRTAVWAVFGVTERGPHETTLIQSYEEYVRIFGGYTVDAKDVPAAVQGFFENGGEFCYVTRIVHYADITVATPSSAKATVTLVDRDDPALDTLQVDAKTDGAWGNSLRIDITAATSGVATEFNLVVKNSSGVVLETWANLSMVDANERYVETIINNATTGSQYITVTDLDSVSAAPDDMPAIAAGSALTTGDNGLTDLADTDFVGSEAGGTGLWRTAEIQDITIVSVPGRTASTVANGILTHLLAREGELFAIAVLDPPANTNASGMVTYVKTTAAIYNLDERLSIFWPRIKVTNPSKTVYGVDDTVTVPPCGHVVGVMARTDNTRPGGVYLPPAGVERGIIRGARGLEMTEVTNERKRDLVYPANINPITTLPGYPIHIDGHRTLKTNGNFPSISERRGVFFIEATIKEAVQFARHSNNDAALRATVERTIEQFLIGQMNVGAFRTTNPETAFFVDVGEGLNTLAVQRAGQLKVRVGLATQSPIDYVLLNFSQDLSAANAAEAAAVAT